MILHPQSGAEFAQNPDAPSWRHRVWQCPSLDPRYRHHAGCREWKCLLTSNGREAKAKDDGNLLLNKWQAPARLSN